MNLEEILSFHKGEMSTSFKEGFFVVEEMRVGKKYRVDYNEVNTCEYDVFKNNKKLKYHERLGICFGDYSEFLINYDDSLFLQLSDIDKFVMKQFKIGSVSVEIGHPSLLFDLSSKCFDGDKYYEKDDWWTISLKGITSDNYEEYLAKALFLLKYYNESPIYGWNPNCCYFSGYYDATDLPEEDIEKLVTNRRAETNDFECMEFKDLQHFEALSFYNEAFYLYGHEISFHYFYKVLEYFFLICREDTFKTYINDYNSRHNMAEFIKSVTDVYKQAEEIQLENLLNSIKQQINWLVVDAKNKGVISNVDMSEFSKTLYMYRNAIVHGKSDQRFKIKMPTVVCSDEDIFWNNAVQKIAEVLIKKYCLDV